MERLTFLLTNITTQPVNLHSDSQASYSHPLITLPYMSLELYVVVEVH